MLLLSKDSFSQKKKMTSIDSCVQFKNIIIKGWRFHKNGNYYNDSSGIFQHINSHPAFIKCLTNKTDKEIFKLLGKPSNYDSINKQNIYNYCLTPNINPNCCKIALYIIFDSKYKVTNVEISNCHLIKD